MTVRECIAQWTDFENKEREKRIKALIALFSPTARAALRRVHQRHFKYLDEKYGPGNDPPAGAMDKEFKVLQADYAKAAYTIVEMEMSPLGKLNRSARGLPLLTFDTILPEK